MSGDEDEGLFEDNAMKSRKRKDYSKLGQGMLTRSKFRSCVENLGLVDGGFGGRKLTWCNNQEGARSIWAILDKVLLNKEWSLNNLNVQHLAWLSSNHAPLLINFEASQFRNVGNAEDDDLAREHDLEVNNCDENLRKLKDAKVTYQQTLLQKKTFWRQYIASRGILIHFHPSPSVPTHGFYHRESFRPAFGFLLLLCVLMLSSVGWHNIPSLIFPGARLTHFLSIEKGSIINFCDRS
ncbi:hypothetical protein NE237_013158 [Protea cynaroides]|uniref:Uncharacterized protein n=1 Tax=Protea cynaroides TaxID=273540 RepID=A0A9Q0JZJ0_9MAGN|nr:hypothetical protein NE237_013158 [Protea cynaroides]